MKIFVPSCDRWENLGMGVARFASPELRQRMTYVVPMGDQLEKYEAAIERQKIGASVIACPEQGIAKTRHWIGMLARHHGADKFLMLDDDVWFYTRTTHSAQDFHLEYSKPNEVNECLDAVEFALDHYAHVGISAREGNNRIDRMVYFNNNIAAGAQLGLECTRTLRALAYRTADFLAVEHGRVEVMEDFDVNLQLLERGLPNINLAHWAQGQRQTNAPGGCSTYRSHEVHEASARRLAELHPGVVRLTEKNNKSGGAFGKRTEVVISWKKAFEKGLIASAIGEVREMRGEVAEMQRDLSGQETN